MKLVDAIKQVLDTATPARVQLELVDLHKGTYDVIDTDELEQIKQLVMEHDDVVYQVCSVIVRCVNASNASFNHQYHNQLQGYFAFGAPAIPPKDVIRCSHCDYAFFTKSVLNRHLRKAHAQVITGAYTVDSAAHLWEIILPQIVPGSIQFITNSEWSAMGDRMYGKYNSFDAAMANRFSMDLLKSIDCYVVLSFGNKTDQNLYIKKSPAMEHATVIMCNTKARNEIISIANKAKITDKEVFEQTVMLLIQTYQINKGGK